MQLAGFSGHCPHKRLCSSALQKNVLLPGSELTVDLKSSRRLHHPPNCNDFKIKREKLPGVHRLLNFRKVMFAHASKARGHSLQRATVFLLFLSHTVYRSPFGITPMCTCVAGHFEISQ